METTLHRQLKELYAGPRAECEVRVGGYRIDARVRGRLFEIQQSSLSALRQKVRVLVENHRVVVVKPLFARKLLVNRESSQGEIISQRRSPKKGTKWDLFLDLVHFVDVFPHPRLTLEVVLIEVREERAWGTSSRGRRRRLLIDRHLSGIEERLVLRTAADLRRWLPESLPATFTTAGLAEAIGVPRWWAQKIAYCLRKTGAIQDLGKQRHSRLYGRDVRRAA